LRKGEVWSLKDWKSAKEHYLVVWEWILLSNHVQSDIKDDVCALKSIIFLCPCTCPPF
jgi:hypothetical protein